MAANHIACPLCRGVIPLSPWPEDQCTRCKGDLAVRLPIKPTEKGLTALEKAIIKGMKVSNEGGCKQTACRANPT